MSSPYFLRRVVLEPAAAGHRVADPSDIVAVHGGALDGAALEALAGAVFLELPLEASEEAIAASLRTVAGGATTTLLDLRALAAARSETPPEAASRALRGVFRLARALQGLGLPFRRVTVATALDGALGFADMPVTQRAKPGPRAREAAAFGAAAGAWKAVAREWAAATDEPVALRLFDLPSSPGARAWNALAHEVGRRGPVEVALGGASATPVLREAAALGARLRLDADSVAVIIGGARGVVAELALEVARRFGCRLVLLGRTAAADHSSGSFDVAAARRSLRATAAGADAHTLNRGVEQMRREHAVAKTLAALRAAGAAEVIYRRGDASKPEEMAGVVHEARERFGRVDLIIHGAGVDRSRNLADKSEVELDEVLAPKVGGAAELFAAGKGAQLVAIGSVSARFGNSGQIDYAAANEALAKLTLAFGGLVLDYTAWSEVGMAAGLARAMRERGVDPLAPADAAKATVDLIAAGATGEWVMSGRLGDLRTGASGAGQGEVVASVPGASLVRRSRLALEALAYLRDHRATAAGLLPGVVALEAMTSAARALEPSLSLHGLRDARFEQPLKVFAGRPVDVEVTARRGQVEGAPGVLACAAHIATEAGRHHTATVLLGRWTEGQSTRPEGPWPGGPTREAIYRLFFHGPSFQVIDETWLQGDRLWARSPRLEGELGTDLEAGVRARALARELAFQAAGAYLVAVERRAALPIGIGALDVFGRAHVGERVDAVVRLRPSSEDGQLFVFDADLFGEDGRPLERLTKLTLRLLAKL